ncbi:MAG: hypothetical protein HQK75_13270 [Candidatus Magnetomorum sp.]|nr:hypothetical protein [Candidatus Magnetomorum sp.]
MGDDIYQSIGIQKVTDPEGKIPDPKILFTIDKVLKSELTNMLSFNIKDAQPGMKIPQIIPSVSAFNVKGPIFQDGYYYLKGESAINFSLERSDGTIVRTKLETANIYQKNPSKLFLNENTLMIQMVEKICKKFVHNFIPSKRQEFREFVKGTQDVNVAIIAATNGNLEGAQELFQDIIKKEPDNAPAFYNLGIVIEAQKVENLNKSLSMYKKAFKLDPANPLYNQNYTRLKNNLEGTTYLKEIKDTLGEVEAEKERPNEIEEE